jgi:arylsulfatase A
MKIARRRTGRLSAVSLSSRFAMRGAVLVWCLWFIASAPVERRLWGDESRRSESRQPNILFILMDDMGWRDVGFMGNQFVETPNLDRLAKRGLVFSQAYASAPNCAPTRACLMSGQYTPRHGIYTVVDPRHMPGSEGHKIIAADSRSELATEVVTIAESLRAGGYRTGFFGMWNLGRGRSGPMTPAGQGFEKVVFPENLGFERNAYFDSKGNYLTDKLTDEVLKFIEQAGDKPFFAYLPDHAVHAPFEPKPELLEKYQRKLKSEPGSREDPALSASVEAVDQNVGRILDFLEERKLLESTLVIFTSDNGGNTRLTPPLKGGKGQLYEGGIRVPLLVAGAGIAKPGREIPTPVATIDWYPTLLELASLHPPASQVLDGVSLGPLLRGEGELKRERMFWHFPCYVGRSTPSSAVREGDWKLIQFFEDGGKFELYNLKADPGEKRDLASSEPDRLKQLQGTLGDWQKETGAALPTKANPAYQPGAGQARGAEGSAGGEAGENANRKRGGQMQGNRGRGGQRDNSQNGGSRNGGSGGGSRVFQPNG